MEYLGDKWLKYCDYLSKMNIGDIMEAQLHTGVQILSPQEVYYFMNDSDAIIETLECVRELKNEPDQSKHNDILVKWNKKPIDLPLPNTDYLG